MLDHEYTLNIDRLGDRRGDNTSFFAFADTVVARSFRGGNECHGWMASSSRHIRTMSRARSPPRAHARRGGGATTGGSWRRRGHLLHGAFFEHHEPEKLVESLLDRLSTDRIEIDLIRFHGIESGVDNRLVALQLVQLGLSGVAMFGPDKEVLQPSEILRKKAVLVERGSFRPTTVVNLDMLECAQAKFEADPAVQGRTVLPLAELTMPTYSPAETRWTDGTSWLAPGCWPRAGRHHDLRLLRLLPFGGFPVRADERANWDRHGSPELIDLFDEQNHT